MRTVLFVIIALLHVLAGLLLLPLLALLFFYGIAPGPGLAAVPFALLIMYATAVGVSLLFSATSVRYRDMGILVPLLTQAWFWSSPRPPRTSAPTTHGFLPCWWPRARCLASSPATCAPARCAPRRAPSPRRRPGPPSSCCRPRPRWRLRPSSGPRISRPVASRTRAGPAEPCRAFERMPLSESRSAPSSRTTGPSPSRTHPRPSARETCD